MISIKKFLSLDTESNEVLMHVVRILVEGIGQHAVSGDSEDCARFQESIKKISDALADEFAPAELLVRAGSVLNALEEHSRRVVRHQRLQTLELQNMVKMLTSTIGIVSAASNANIGILGEIEKQVVVASQLDDVRIIKAKLSDCLHEIRKEAERQQTETKETVQQLGTELDQARKRPGNALESEPTDSITGLLLRPSAEVALAQSGRQGPQAYVVVMVLDRLQILNARFGRPAGDEILAEFTSMVQQQLNPEDRMFRWAGAALLALLPRAGSLECVRSEIGRVMETRLEHTIQTPSRGIMVPIAARWTVFPMMAAPRLFFQKIDTFVVKPAPRD